MSASYKHGGHRYNGQTRTTSANSDQGGVVLIYDAYPGNPSGTVVNSSTSSYDPATEQVVEASFVLDTSLTGQATNYNTFNLIHYNSAGSVVHHVSTAFDGATKKATAFVPCNLGVSSGATVPGAGAATLTVVAGSSLPWTLSPGDTIYCLTSHDGSGQYTGAVGYTVKIAAKGA